MKYLYMTLGLLLCAPFTRGQEFPYVFSAFNEAYVPLSEATTIEDGVIWDDPEWVVPIGFNFTYMDETFSEFLFIGTGSQLIPAVPEQEVAVLIPYLADIINASFANFVSPVRYTLEGAEGFRVFKLEWSNVGFYEEGFGFETFSNTTNFQLWLYESTNDFEIRFGPNTIKSPEVVHVYGVPGVILAKNFSLEGTAWEGLWTLTGDPASPTVQVAVLVDDDITPAQLLTGEPADGQVYHFDSGIVSVQEEEQSRQGLIAYPTYVNESINLRSNQEHAIVARVYDITGRIAQNWIINPGTSVQSTHDLASGSYLLTVEGQEAIRFIKE